MSENLNAQIFTPAQLEKLADWRALNEYLGIPEPARGHEDTRGQINDSVPLKEASSGQMEITDSAAKGDV